MEVLGSHSLHIFMVNPTDAKSQMPEHMVVGRSSDLLYSILDPEITCYQLHFNNA